MDFLRNIPISQLAQPSKEVVIFYSTESVREALQRLSFHGILSAPVFDAETNMCVGSIDVLDLVTYVLAICKRDTPEKRKAIFNSPLSYVAGASNCNPFLPISASASLLNVVQTLLAHGVHRVPVVAFSEGNMEITGIVSKFDVIQYLYDNRNNADVTRVLSKTVSQLEFVPGGVISIREDCTLEAAFEDIIANSISGLAVVDKEGKLIGNLSATDFKGFTEENFDQLQTKVGEFIKYQVPVTCTRNSTLKHVIGSFVKEAVHRVYIIDDKKQPIGIVAITDVMKVISHG